MSHVPPRRTVRRRASLLAALGLTAMALGPVGSAQAVAPPTDTWTGAHAATSTNWSDALNWSNGVPASGQVLDFTAPSPSCSASPCPSNNNLAVNTQFGGLKIDTGRGYGLSGNAFDLGGSGITATSTGQSVSSIQNDIRLAAAQTWSLTQGSVLILDGQLSGNGVPLQANLSGASMLWLGGIANVGAIGLTGQDATRTGPNAGANGSLIVNQALNGTSGSAINATAVEIDAQPNQGPSPTVNLGPLSLSGSALQVGSSSANNAGLVNTPSLSLDSASETRFYLGAGSTAGVSYSQLHATGNVQLNGGLRLSGTDNGPGSCSVPAVGSIDTIVHAGTLSGSFTGVPQDSIVEIPTACDQSTRAMARIHYDYAAGTVTTTRLNGSTTTLTTPSGARSTNQPVTLTATVNPSGGTPTGTIAFVNYGRPIAGCDAQPVSGGTATCTTQTLVGAQQHLTAVFSPDTSSTVGGSQSSEVVYTVNPDATTTALTASSSNVTPGSKVTYTATVTPADSGPNQPNQWGAVQFADHGTPIDCGTGHSTYGEPMNAGNTATCVVTYPAAGSHSITAAYAQDDYAFSSSKSVAQSITVAAPAPAPAPTPAPAPAPTPKPAPAPAPAPAGTGTPHIGTPAVQGTSVAVPVSCAKGGPSCHITAKLIAVKAPRGHKVIAVAPGTKITHTAILVGTATTTVKAGQHKQVRVKLNGSGKRLLAKDHGLKVKMTISRKVKGGKSSTVASTTVTFRAITKQKKSRKKH